MYRPFIAMVLALGASACSDITYQEPVAFRAELVSAAVQGISGSVAAVSQGRSTQAGIEAVLPQGGVTVGWQINLGTCDNPGEMHGGRGAYLDITSRPDGVARLERTFINEVMSPDRRYHAVVVDAGDRSIVLACGNMDRLSI